MLAATECWAKWLTCSKQENSRRSETSKVKEIWQHVSYEKNFRTRISDTTKIAKFRNLHFLLHSIRFRTASIQKYSLRRHKKHAKPLQNPNDVKRRSSSEQQEFGGQRSRLDESKRVEGISRNNGVRREWRGRDSTAYNYDVTIRTPSDGFLSACGGQQRKHAGRQVIPRPRERRRGVGVASMIEHKKHHAFGFLQRMNELCSRGLRFGKKVTCMYLEYVYVV